LFCYWILQDIPGCGKFRKKALQNQECLREMFGDISSDETDHWNPMTDNPIVPESQQDLINVDSGDVEEEEEHQDMVHDWNYSPEEEELGVQEVSPSIANQKKRALLS
jgi:hypothetical protein